MAGKHFPWSRGKRRSVGLRRTYREEAYAGYGYRYAWSVKGHRDEAFDMVADRDAQYDRARRSAGWKNRRCRHQWEHNEIERAEHDSSRRRKAVKRKG